jgi:hypothetical protein
MQVLCLDTADPCVRVQILGHYMHREQPDDEIEMLLSGGSAQLHAAEPVSVAPAALATPKTPAKSATSATPATSATSATPALGGRDQHWVFGAGDQWTRERWTWITAGRRWFLVKSIAYGGSRALAEQRFAGATAWFDAVAAQFVIR